MNRNAEVGNLAAWRTTFDNTANCPGGFLQEWCNAWTIVITPCYCWWRFIGQSDNVFGAGSMQWLTILMSIHAPFSVLYHSVCAWNCLGGHKRDDTIYRCLDQSCTQVVIFTAFAYLSPAFLLTSTIALPFALYNIHCLWVRNSTEPRYKRHVRMGLFVLLTLSLILLQGDLWHFFCCLTCFTMGSACFALDIIILNGWGHSLFHVFLVLLWHFIFSALELLGKSPGSIGSVMSW